MHRRHQPAADGELLEPGRRQVVAAGGGDDAVEGRVRRVAEPAVAVDQPHVTRGPGMQVRTRLVVQRACSRSIDSTPLRQQRQQAPSGNRSRCRSRARGRAVRRHARVAFEQQAEHARHHRRLGDGLPQPDRQAGVFVGLRGQRAVDEMVPRHLAHRLAHGVVAMELGAQPLHQRARTAAESRPRPLGRCCCAASRAACCSGACGRSRSVPRGAAPGAPGPARPGKRAPRGGRRHSPAPCRGGQARNAAQRPQAGMVGQVDLQRRDRHAAVGAVAWKSVPSPASRASPAGPIQ